MITWTPDAVASSRRKADLEIWRAVEAQHVVSTMRLVDSLEEQRVLEALLDEGKPTLAAALQSLHYLLAAPFRYRPPAPGSRFRGPDDPGVFYGAEHVRTACAEAGWWRWRGFVAEAPGLPQLPPVGFTIFPVQVRDSSVDLRKPPIDRDRKRWMHPTDYGPTQAFARIARDADVGMLLYASVRDPQHGANVAVLRPQAFHRFQPTRAQTWQLVVGEVRVSWLRAGEEGYSFDVAEWSD